MNDPILTGPQVRQYLGGISSQTLWRWRRTRGFPEPTPASPKTNLWRQSEIDNWLERQRGEVA